MLHFRYVESAREFAEEERAHTAHERSAGAHEARNEAVEDALFDVRRHVVPPLRRRLAEVSKREDELVRELASHGISAATIGPIVPPDRAQETKLGPEAGPVEHYSHTPIGPRPSFLERLRGRRPGQRRRS